MNELEEIEAIKRLKYKYFRCVDCKLWAELKGCFVEDATTSYSSGMYSYQGVDAIIKFLSKVMNPTISMHQGHHPEIELTSEISAKGMWALQDYVILLKSNSVLRGAAFYTDEYVKVDGEWRIKHTGYVRTFEEVFDRADIKSLKLTQSMFPSPEDSV